MATTIEKLYEFYNPSYTQGQNCFLLSKQYPPSSKQIYKSQQWSNQVRYWKRRTL